jgi:alanine racemase
MKYPAPVWSEINLNAIAHNTRELKKITNPNAEVMAIVKANAYGHGAEQVARVALQNGATRLGVARVNEGKALREAGIDAPVLVLGYTVPEEFEVLLENNLIQTIYSYEAAEQLSATAARAGKKAVVHIKVDTGMGRLGFIPGRAAVEEVVRICRLPRLDIEGIYTHFAAADCQNKDYTWQQWHKFTQFISALGKEGVEFPCRHAANSAGIIDLPETHLNMVRAGIALYGIHPSGEVRKDRATLVPAMAVKARVAHVKRVPAGTGISYGVTYVTTKDTVVATIPAGYADGYSRLLSSRGEVLIRGTRAPVIGRVCMDQFMVDVGHIPGIATGEEVVLLGDQGSDRISADEIARKIGTIAYEVLCMISARVPRYYLER